MGNDFMKMMTPEEIAQPEPKVELEAESGTCTDGHGHTCAEVCCFDGTTLTGCCPYTLPVCDALDKTCRAGDDSNDFMQMMIPVEEIAEPEVKVELEAESGTCTDGHGHTCAEVCCFDGVTLTGCCPYTLPVCDALDKTCRAGDESSDFMQMMVPVDAAEPETKVELEAES